LPFASLAVVRAEGCKEALVSLYQLDWSEEPEALPDLAWDWSAATAATAAITVFAVDGATGASSRRALSRVADRRAAIVRRRRAKGERAVSHRLSTERVVHTCVAARPPP
jgi:hypothetical protein